MFIALRDLRFAKGRFGLVGGVVVLMTLLVVLLSGLTAGLSRSSTSAITGLPADHLAFAAPGSGDRLSFAESTVTAQQWQRWSQVDGVAAAQPLGIANVKAATGGRSAALAAFGVAPGSPLAPDADRIAAGQVVLSQDAAGALHASVGGSVELSGERMRVAGIDGSASYSHLPVVWTSLADWQHLAPGGHGEQATVVALTTRPGADLSAADQRIGTHTVSQSGALSAIPSYPAENGSLQLMRALLFAISALVTGAFFTVWTVQRTPDVAVLGALGAGSRYLLRDALGQALVVLVAGTAVGAAIAAGVGAAAASVVPFVLGAGSVLAPAAVLVALGAVGAALAIRRVTSVDPLTALGSAR